MLTKKVHPRRGGPFISVRKSVKVFIQPTFRLILTHRFKPLRYQKGSGIEISFYALFFDHYSFFRVFIFKEMHDGFIFAGNRSQSQQFFRGAEIGLVIEVGFAAFGAVGTFFGPGGEAIKGGYNQGTARFEDAETVR